MADLPDTLVFFDSDCLLCDRSVQWLVRHDPGQRLRFAPLGGETYEVLKGEGAALSQVRPGQSIIFATRDGDGAWQTATRSDAVLAALEATGGAPVRLALLRLFPKCLRDLGYRFVAATRYRIFGKTESCSLAAGAAAERLFP